MRFECLIPQPSIVREGSHLFNESLLVCCSESNLTFPNLSHSSLQEMLFTPHNNSSQCEPVLYSRHPGTENTAGNIQPWKLFSPRTGVNIQDSRCQLHGRGKFKSGNILISDTGLDLFRHVECLDLILECICFIGVECVE